MPNDHTSVRALIAGYKACERPSEATEARIQRALASAQRHSPAPRSSVRLAAAAPWLALAAALLLLFAWRAGSPNQVTRDRGSLSSFTAATPKPEPVTTRSQPPITVADDSAPSQRSADDTRPPIAADDTTSPSPTTARPSAGDKPRKTTPPPLAPDRVLAEMALLQRAQEALRAQRPADALAVLDRHAEAFPDGDLAEERQALRVTALCADGASQQGLALRAAFMRAYPRSAYATRVAAACPSTDGSTDSSPPVNGTSAQR